MLRVTLQYTLADLASVSEGRSGRQLGRADNSWTLTTEIPMASSSVAMYSRNIPTMQTRLVRIPAVAAELLRQVSWTSILRASIRAEERFCLRSFRRELGVFITITFGDRMHASRAELPVLLELTANVLQ